MTSATDKAALQIDRDAIRQWDALSAKQRRSIQAYLETISFYGPQPATHMWRNVYAEVVEGLLVIFTLEKDSLVIKSITEDRRTSDTPAHRPVAPLLNSTVR